MELQLKNIGMIKEANIKLDGLTVIAGENDTGKSTVGKFLYFTLCHDLKTKKDIDTLFESIFKTNIAKYNTPPSSVENNNKDFKLQPIFIETPLVWNFTDFFRDIALVESQMNIEIDYPYLMKDLNFKLFIKNASNGVDIKEKMTSLMDGKFEKDEKGSYFFNRNGKRIELVNTATGIKYFGIFQVLSQNNYLNKNTVLVLDEPEVHLHPKWQLEMAKIIVELVKNGVKVLVNSHSPYMIEALQRYSELAEINSDFYLAEDGYIKKENNSNSETLAKIFEKLSEPFDVFEEMDSQKMKKLING
ncbi:AAA family ATPase [Sulfurovum sp. NBC37-1]|uniref:AAA family ATPase n=1 Tax=Sulfurovum sp. (strain NBC37-1) TaxID=387093 RepID=UPI0001587798|nr:AAA family ATPase [Sulfurovum sp. NBC37-1]BAF71317.1 ABC transporter, ATP-binding protein [Sulfurovum sp. NBC37-1]